MKKIMLFIFMLIYLFSVKNVLAQDQYKLTLEKQEKIFISRAGNNLNDSQNFYLYKFGNMYAYCIQPGKHITTYNYLGIDNFVDFPISDEIKEKLELIGYYGRDYPSHDNIRYSMATQALIWELTGADSVTFWTKLNASGEEIDVTKERNEIMNLVNKHQEFPNINKDITAYIGKEIVITDSNNLLNEYEVLNKRGNEIKIVDNALHIMPNIIGEDKITLKYKKYDDLKTIIFVGKDNESQVMGILRFSNDKELNINLKVKGIRLMVKKVDEGGNRINIKGIRFKIKSLSDNNYLCENDTCEYVTDDEGVFITKELNYGEYEIEELDNDLEEYLLNPNKVKVILDENTHLKEDNNYNYIDINFINERVKGDIEIYKKGEEVFFHDNEISYDKNSLANVRFDLYNGNDELIDTVKTDDNGYVKYSGLLVGKYYLKEKNSLDNYVLNNEKISFEIKKENNKGSSVRLEIDNYLKKGVLEFSKEDLLTGEGIPNRIIEIYNDSDNLILTKETDEIGKIVINKLPIGKYYIIEKEANTMYKITNEKVYFEIKEDGEIVKAKMTNEKKTIDVPKTDTKESLIVHSLFGLSLLIGIGRFYYERKEAS